MGTLSFYYKFLQRISSFSLSYRPPAPPQHTHPLLLLSFNNGRAASFLLEAEHLMLHLSYNNSFLPTSFESRPINHPTFLHLFSAFLFLLPNSVCVKHVIVLYPKNVQQTSPESILLFNYYLLSLLLSMIFSKQSTTPGIFSFFPFLPYSNLAYISVAYTESAVAMVLNIPKLLKSKGHVLLPEIFSFPAPMTSSSPCFPLVLRRILSSPFFLDNLMHSHVLKCHPWANNPQSGSALPSPGL